MKRMTDLRCNRFSVHPTGLSYLTCFLLLLVPCMSVDVAWSAPKGDSGVVIVVSPSGDDSGGGTKESPFRTLRRAQQAVREVNADHDVTVELGDGIYRLSEPLIFTALDGGRN